MKNLSHLNFNEVKSILTDHEIPATKVRGLATIAVGNSPCRDGIVLVNR